MLHYKKPSSEDSCNSFFTPLTPIQPLPSQRSSLVSWTARLNYSVLFSIVLAKRCQLSYQESKEQFASPIHWYFCELNIIWDQFRCIELVFHGQLRTWSWSNKVEPNAQHIPTRHHYTASLGAKIQKKNISVLKCTIQKVYFYMLFFILTSTQFS